jgi:uncharacterized membrane protein
MSDLAAMIQVSIVAYASAGTFLGLAYFDYFYLLVALVVGLTVVLKQEMPNSDHRVVDEPAPPIDTRR